MSKLLTYDQKTFFGNHTQQPNVVYNCAQWGGLSGLEAPPQGVSVQPEIVNSTTHQKRLPMSYGFKNNKEFL